MSLNRIQEKAQAFTFGSEQFPLTNIPKSSHDSKLPPFNKILKSNRQLQFQNQNDLPLSHKRGKSQQLMDTIHNKENQFVSLNVNQRVQTETNSSIIHKPPQSRFRIPRKLSNYSRPQSKEDQNRYKTIAEQLKQMFILQKYLLEQGQNAQLQQLYQQFEILCKQL
ncbi:unnamed protein product (macronuclear) [Paramecium tetraurelia]|uniref:Uncharacterized protein n=1 Tax=Paramecium tetraurelia TaxID=5888 RepID=A0CKR8_PARTE|nr:uncharacterized protein GSPATT00001099001 [Paramecium tetraurelia]CAK71385.1 unnamed protein product [Paramecium tetraurelia]|eukprot:XP_001438782.1 hypothetical protein (macronuclear) [Paramecium tetraurelia strain d4-2]